MADVVNSLVLHPFNDKSKATRRLVMKFTNVSDGTGESNVVKVDKSTLLNVKGVEPTDVIIERIDFSVVGMVVKVSYDRTSDVTVAILSDTGSFDYTSCGGLCGTGAGDTGDILFSTIGHSSNDTYDITLYMRLD